MEFSKQRVARLTVALAAIVVAGVIPADARNPDRDRAEEAGIDSDTRHLGDINPTSVSIVSTDFALASYSYPVMDTLSADAAQTAATGAGVVVAVLDGGFDPAHPEIAANLLPGFDAIDLDDDVTDRGNGWDDDRDGVTDRGVGHGTFVAGMVLRTAPDAMILPIRVRDDEGRGTNEVLKRGLDHALASGAQVINMSLSDANTMDRGFSALLKEAGRSGVSLVFSAGNDGESRLNDIAYTHDALAVGAVDAYDRIASFSNYIDQESSRPYMVFAPGVNLYGPMYVAGHESDGGEFEYESEGGEVEYEFEGGEVEYEFEGELENGFYASDDDDDLAGMAVNGYWSGTSFSAGTISGAVALVRQLHPEWSASEVSFTVATSVVPVTTREGFVLPYAGRIDLAELVTR